MYPMTAKLIIQYSTLLQPMLSYIMAQYIVISDGLHYVEDCTDATQCKEVFKLIFDTLEQG